jgi:hypothetical protein
METQDGRAWSVTIAGQDYRLRIPLGFNDVRRLREAFNPSASAIDQGAVAAAALGVAFDGDPPWGAFDAAARADVVGYGDRVIAHFEQAGAVYREAIAVGYETLARLLRALPDYRRIEQTAGN